MTEKLTLVYNNQSRVKSRVKCDIITITHSDDSSQVSIAIIRLCDSVCPYDTTKTAETKITKLGTGIVHHDTLSTNEY